MQPLLIEHLLDDLCLEVCLILLPFLFLHASFYTLRANQILSESGKEVVSLRLPPLETVRAPLNAHSLSTSRTARLFLLFLL